MNTLYRFTLLLALIYPLPAIQADQPATDFSASAKLAKQQGVPLMVLFGSTNCIFCDKLATEVLEPQVESGQLKRQVKLLKINIHRGGKFTDFDGDPIRSRIFIDRYKVIATPTVIFMDYDGAPLSKPLMGYTSDSRYPETLKMAIERATAVLTSHTEETRPHIKVGSAAHTDISITERSSVQ